jgi:ATP-dependent DNA helicase HFM1/MER3
VEVGFSEVMFWFLCRYFNSLQSECFHVCFFSDVNMVISAPTGSGKTVLFELCILRLLSRFLSPDWRFNLNKGTLKTVCTDSECHF